MDEISYAATSEPLSELSIQAAEQLRWARVLKKIAHASMVGVFVIPVIALLGWTFNIEIAGSFTSERMNPVTALALLFGGAAVWLRQREQLEPRYARFAEAASGIVALIGLLRLSEDCIPGLHLGLDRFLFSAQVGRYLIGTGTAMALLLLGFSLAAMDAKARGLRTAQQCAVWMATLLAMATLMGYLYAVPNFFGAGIYRSMAPQTAAALMLLCMAILLARPDRSPVSVLCSESTGGVIARRLLPWCLIVPPALGWLRMLGIQKGWWSWPVGSAGLILAVTVMMLLLVWRCALLLIRLDVERQEVDAELRKAKNAAETANNVKSAFIATISHELRTPLTAISGFADMYFAAGRSLAQKDDDVRTIRRNGEHLLTVISDLLDLSKIESGRMTVERLHFSPSEILGGVMSMMRPSAVAKGLSLELAYETPMPETIHSDPTRMRQIVLNLISNAIKFTDRGAVKVIVSMSVPCYAPEPVLQIRVVDSGIGIDAEQQRKVFQPFVQADASMARRFGGSGLGLSIARHFAILLGGDVTVASEPGRGSTFTATLKTGSLVGIAMLAKPCESIAATPEAFDLSPMYGNILLAEDGIDNQRLIEALLSMSGATVTVVENGELAVQEALRASREKRPYDVILMDVQMAVMDGLEATAQLRDKGYSQPIVALTANAADSDRERCLQAGCNDFLSKPIDRQRMFAAVRRYLHSTPQAEARESKLFKVAAA